MSAQSITPELRQWAAEQLAAGCAPAELAARMCQAGWDESVAAQAVAAASQTAPSATTNAPRPGAMPGPDLAESPLLIDGGDRQAEVLLRLDHPRIVLLGGLLSPDECAALIAAAAPRMERSRTVQTQTGGEEVNHDRTSDGMFFQRGETELVRRIEARIARLLRWPVDNGEGLQVLHYRPGAEYKPHYDYFDPDQAGTPTLLARGGQRVATLVMYLNSPAKGGATTFPDAGLQVAPRQGNAVFFGYARPHPDTRTLHGGAPVIEGEKWIATKWLREREFN
jgi:prolyl 4-hydroxylase